MLEQLRLFKLLFALAVSALVTVWLPSRGPEVRVEAAPLKSQLTPAVNSSSTDGIFRSSSFSAGSSQPTPFLMASAKAAASSSAARRSRRNRRRYSPWTTPTYADSTVGDRIDGEDLTARRAAVEALGRFNGAVVVVDPRTGRLLTVVNQKKALSAAFQPCSTVKVPVAFAALLEGIITPQNTRVRVYRRRHLTLEKALAHSNNTYFARLGQKLGFQRVIRYLKMFGFGEKAGLHIPGEIPGRLPKAPPPRHRGGVGKMTSFGEGIEQTPLQLAAFLAAMANGGTLYYLQYPRNAQELIHYVPRVKRRLPIGRYIDVVKRGMLGATSYGTAKAAAYSPEEPIYGKTGTCTENRTHLGWFGSFNEVYGDNLVVVVLLTGGRPSTGPTAARIAGKIYRTLSQRDYFVRKRLLTPAALIALRPCCPAP